MSSFPELAQVPPLHPQGSCFLASCCLLQVNEIPRKATSIGGVGESLVPRDCGNYNSSLPLGYEVCLFQAEHAGTCLESPWISWCNRLDHKQQLGTQDGCSEEMAGFENQDQAGEEASWSLIVVLPYSETSGLYLLFGVMKGDT